jgi:hypothetical protein
MGWGGGKENILFLDLESSNLINNNNNNYSTNGCLSWPCTRGYILLFNVGGDLVTLRLGAILLA